MVPRSEKSSAKFSSSLNWSSCGLLGFLAVDGVIPEADATDSGRITTAAGARCPTLYKTEKKTFNKKHQ